MNTEYETTGVEREPHGPAYVADPREMVGLPAPDFAALAEHERDEQLEAAVQNIIFEREQLNPHTPRDVAAREAIALVREASPRAYTDRLTLPAELVEAGWQILNSRDETTWHDIGQVVDCADPGCTTTAGIGDEDVSCIVLVGEAWGDGFAHFPTTALVDVRIPAGDR